MGKYFLSFGLSYLGALLLFAALGTVSLFRWPVGPVPVGFRLLWSLIPMAGVFLLGRLCARHWRTAAVALAPRELLILLAVMAGVFVLSWFVEALQPLAAPGLFGLSAHGIGAFLLGLLGNLLFPALFHLGWRL